MGKQTTDEDAEIDGKEILQKLKGISIPDTRKLQQRKIESVGIISQDEKHIENYRGQEQIKKPRIVLLPADEQKRIYSLSIPFDFTHVGSFSSALHITTKKGLESLIKIFQRNNLSFRLSIFHNELFYSYPSRDIWPSIVVPYSWEADTTGWADGDIMKDLEFIPFDYKLEACTYIALEEITEVQEREEIYNHLNQNSRPWHQISTTVSSSTKRETYSDITVFCLGTCSGHPEYYLQKMLDKRMEEMLTESGKEKIPYSGALEREKSRIINAKATLFYLSKSVVVYDPKWIGEGLRSKNSRKN